MLINMTDNPHSNVPRGVGNGGHMPPSHSISQLSIVSVLVIGYSQMGYLNCLRASKVCRLCNEASGRERKPLAL